MTTLAEFMIIAGADNRPPMLEKSMYDSWKSRMKLYMKNRENERMILESVLNGPLVWPTIVQEDGTTRKKKYEELSATKKGEILYQYYWRFAQLINNMNIINMSMRPVQVNTKFLNSLPPEWSKFVTDVKLDRDLHTTNYDQLYSYLEQHETHANVTRLMRERYQDPLAFVANYNQPPSHLSNYHSQYKTTQFPQQTNTMIPPQVSTILNHIHQGMQHLSYHNHKTCQFLQLRTSFVVPVFTKEDDPIICLNKAMDFLSAVVASWFPSTNNQLRTSSNPRNQATIQDGRVTVQQEGRQDEEQLAFLADPCILEKLKLLNTIPNNALSKLRSNT
ncbi:hypothetical protein Tco_0618417 [Tanacetum coccineum]